MEQIGFFLTQYADGILVAASGVVVILLLVTLHRIRKMEKYMQEITGNTRAVRRQKRRGANAEQSHAAADSSDASGQEAELACAVSGDCGAAGKQRGTTEAVTPLFASAKQEHAGEAVNPESPAELIDAVLEEVFL